MDKSINKKTVNINENCLSTIRLFAALQVIFGHAVKHFELFCPAIVPKIVGYFSGVSIFFAISGFLIWLSIERSASYGDYLKKRFFRIYPELWVGVAVEIISILIFYRGWEIKSLLAFAFTQSTFLQFWTPDSLRGYGCGTPNGTIWTICATVQFYLVAWFLHKFMHKKKPVFWIVGFAALVSVSVIGHRIAKLSGADIVVGLFDQTIFRFLWLFYIGCFIAEFKERVIPVISKYWLIFLCVGVISVWARVDVFAGYRVCIALSLATGLIGFAYRFPRLAVKTDISYGLFIYHMIVINVFLSLGLTGSWSYFIVTTAVSCLLAFVSAKTVGKWASCRKLK